MKAVIDKIEILLKKIIKCRMLYYIVIILLLVATYYIDLKVKVEEQNLLENGEHLKYFLIASAISGFAVIFLIIFSKKLYKKLKPHIVYIIIGLVLGIMYVFAMPLCTQSDEIPHMLRAYQITKGEFISPIIYEKSATEVPKSIGTMLNLKHGEEKREYKKYYDIKEMAKIELNKDDTKLEETVGTYHGLCYFPQIIGLKIGMMFNLNPYYSFMLGRLTGVIIIVLLFGFGISKLPTHKLFASIVLMSPVVLSYAASYSADSITLLSVFLFLSYVLMFRHTKRKIKVYEYLILIFLIIMVSISKFTYLPIIGILIFIPKECYKDIKIKWILSIIFICIGILSSFVWMKLCNVNVIEGTGMVESNTWIYKNPIGYLTILFRTTINSGYSYLENMFAGYFLCHKQIEPYAIVPLGYIIITIASFFNDKNKEKTSFWVRLIVLGIISVCYILISTAMYIYNTEYMGKVIIGVQGRYLVPVLLLVTFFGNNKKIEIPEYRLVNVALIANYAVFLTMFARFLV